MPRRRCGPVRSTRRWSELQKSPGTTVPFVVTPLNGSARPVFSIRALVSRDRLRYFLARRRRRLGLGGMTATASAARVPMKRYRREHRGIDTSLWQNGFTPFRCRADRTPRSVRLGPGSAGCLPSADRDDPDSPFSPFDSDSFWPVGGRRADQEELYVSPSACAAQSAGPKKEAKELLDSKLSRHPDCKLADAQHALARDYGFDSWPKLRGHVDALATVHRAHSKGR